MADATYQGHAKSLAAYVRAGGDDVDHFSLGYSHGGRNGVSNSERDHDWSPSQIDAYNAGVQARLSDNAAIVVA